MNKDDIDSQKDTLLPASIIVAGIMISASIIYLIGNKAPAPSAGNPAANGQPVANEQVKGVEISSSDAVLGANNAPVSLIEYGDYQCPFCGRFFKDTEGKLRDEYIKTGKVKMAFRNFQFLGPESTAAAEAVLCSKDQGKFWEFHDAIYNEELKDGKENSGNLNRGFFVKTAGALGLNAGQFSSCIEGNKHADQIETDRAGADAVGANSTPTIFINGEKIQGALPYEQFKAIIERKLKNG